MGYPPAMHKDPRFWAAMAAGPLFWLGLFGAGTAVADPAWVLQRPSAFLRVALLFPVAEEAVFRGFLQGELAHRLPRVGIGPLTAANLLTSVLFSLLHLLAHSPLWAAGVFLPSLAFGYFKDRYGGLAAPIALHAWYNAGYFALFAGS
ncbi:MAG TPA: JDVT-CTERM system glutamic-type intramembrane protease [Gammaproteobacteria bacterium]|nr:JDVT-CTERM system glutamic-type intramembrane protease [Gammaproteobacteria bacterium]